MARVGILRYPDIKRVKRLKMSSITNNEILEPESGKDVEKRIRNTTDEETLEKESVTVTSQG